MYFSFYLSDVLNCLLPCVYVQKRSGLFGGLAFIQPIRAI